MYDFDTQIDRYVGYSQKWHKYPKRDILPLWVADMDFVTAPEIMLSLEQTLRHGVFGYSMQQSEVAADVVKYVENEYSWKITAADIIWLPGLVAGINLACRALTSENDSIITATPIYPPFLSAPKLAERGLITTELVNLDGVWQWDLADLEQKIMASDLKPRLLLLCNPHNPVGRVWTRGELEQILELVIRHDLWVCSDEIHCDLVLDQRCKHIPFASLNAEAAKRTLTLMAPSKTYNIAGLNCAFAITSNPEIRTKLAKIMHGLFSDINIFGIAACQAALTQGGAWRGELLDYLRINRDLVLSELANLAGLKVTIPEATYLAWIDGRELCAKYQLANLQQFFEVAGVGLSDGADFGNAGFVRLNFGTNRAILVEALQRMRLAVANIIK